MVMSIHLFDYNNELLIEFFDSYYYSFKHNGFIDGFEREYNDLIQRASF